MNKWKKKPKCQWSQYFSNCSSITDATAKWATPGLDATNARTTTSVILEPPAAAASLASATTTSTSTILDLAIRRPASAGSVSTTPRALTAIGAKKDSTATLLSRTVDPALAIFWVSVSYLENLFKYCTFCPSVISLQQIRRHTLLFVSVLVIVYWGIRESHWPMLLLAKCERLAVRYFNHTA